MNKIIVCSTLALSFAAVGCSKLTIIGVSGEHDDAAVPLTTPAPRSATEIAGLRGQLLQAYDPQLGDIDGDGYDDFVLGGSTFVEGSNDRRGIVYLYYGRPKFPEKLSASDADATFETESLRTFALGDVNGDGLADLGVAVSDGFEIILGNTQRLKGHHARLSTGLVFHYTPGVGANDDVMHARIETLTKLGDLNGDGKGDFSVTIIVPNEDPAIFSPNIVEYVVEGRADGWPTGEFDASLAVAQLGSLTSPEASSWVSVLGSGDLNGDGYSDLLTIGYDRSFLFYGKPEGLRGTLTSKQADVKFDFSAGLPMVIGDFDGDGADELALTENDALRIVYGSKTRWSGTVAPTPELSLVDQAPYSVAVVGDTNGDGRPDLIFDANLTERPFDLAAAKTLSMRLFVLHGTDKRLTGELHGIDSVFEPVGYTVPAVLNGGGFNISLAGDLDGDGSTDLITGVPGQNDPADSLVYLLPGSMRDPE